MFCHLEDKARRICPWKSGWILVSSGNNEVEVANYEIITKWIPQQRQKLLHCDKNIMNNFRTMMTMRMINNANQYYKWWWGLLCESSLVTYSLLRSNVNVSTFALFTFGIALREFFRKCSDSLFVFWVPLNILSSSQYSLSIPIFLSCTARVQKCHAHRFVSYNSVPPGHCCPIVNIRGHPPPARFPKQIFQLLQ